MSGRTTGFVPASIVDVEHIEKHTFQMLRKSNLLVALLFGVVSLLLLIDACVEFDLGLVPVYGVWWVRTEATFKMELQIVDRKVRVIFLVFVVTAAACIDHLLVSTVFRGMYESRLARGQNPFRWLEYSISASVMNILIAMECGVLDVLLLTAIGALTATCMAFGWLGELVREKEVQEVIFWIGCCPFLAAWGIIGASLAAEARAYTSIPDFVWAVVICLFLLECAFAVNQFVPRKSFVVKEITFIILSPTAKFLLAAIAYGGIRSLPRA